MPDIIPVIPDNRVPDPPTPPTSRWVLPATIVGSGMSFIDGSVVNVALPSMQQTLQATLAAMQWVVNGYMLALTGFMLLGGAFGDRFGHRQVFSAGLVTFAAASVACGISPSVGWLIGARVVQGFGAALLVPSSLALIATAYGEEERGRAIGTWSAAAATMTAIGPPLGGWLVDAFGWQSIFYLNPPLALLALLMVSKLPAGGGGNRNRLDFEGAGLGILALALFCYGLIALGAGRTGIGAAAVLASFSVGALFLRVEARSPNPIVPLGLFRSRDFSGANAATVFLYAGLSGALFILPLTLIRAHGYTAFAAGAAMLPFPVTIALGSRWAGSVSDRLGARKPLVFGSLLAAAGFLTLALASRLPDYWLSQFPGLLLVGIGMTAAIPPLTTTVFRSVPQQASGTASGINNIAARGGGLIAVAAIGLAFGSTDLAATSAGELLRAERHIMLAAALLAMISMLVALFAIAPGSRNSAE